MAKWRYEQHQPAPNKQKLKIHCFTCKRDVPTHNEAGRKHRGHECEYVPDPGKN